MQIKTTTPFTTSEKGYVKQLIGCIKQGDYVFLLGASGIGKTTVIKAAKAEIEEIHAIKCHYIDLGKAGKKGAPEFYNHVINSITGPNETIEWGDDLSDEFIELLNERTASRTILMFDGFRAVNSDFYEHFSRDCRRVYNEGKAYPDSGIAKIVMVFSGSLVASESHETSPLWNITEQIELIPLSNNEERATIQSYFQHYSLPFTNETIKSVADLICGHRYLAESLTKFISKNGISNLLLSFSDHIWEVVNRSDSYLTDDARELKQHFFNIMEYLETSAYVLTVVLDLYEGKPNQGSPYPAIDHATITGAVSKDDSGSYSFANPIYKKFLERLLTNHSFGDFCLFHTEEEELWLRGKNIYKKLYDSNIRRDLEIAISPFRRKSDTIVRKLINKLRASKDVKNLTRELADILFLIFDIDSWGIFEINYHGNKWEIYNIDHSFMENEKYPTKKWIYHENIVKQANFINRVLASQSPLFDWSEQWLAVPVVISEVFGRLLILKVEAEKKRTRWYKALISFIHEALTVYYYSRTLVAMKAERDSLKKKLEALKGLPAPSYRQEMTPLWKFSKDLYRHLAIKEFAIYEILEDDEVLCTRNNAEEWQKIDLKTKLESMPEINDVVKKIRNGKSQLFVKYSNTCYLGDSMDSGALMLLAIPMKPHFYKNNRKKICTLFNLMKFALNKSWNLNHTAKIVELYKGALLGGVDFVYILDENYIPLFHNAKMKTLFGLKKNEEISSDKTCYELLNCKDEVCQGCMIREVFNTGRESRLYRNVKIGEQKIKMNCIFVPIFGESKRKARAVAVFMHDFGGRMLLWESIEEMEKFDKIEDMDDFILDKLEEFGFKRIFSYRPDPKAEFSFISEDFRGIEEPYSEKAIKFKEGKKGFKSQFNNFEEGRRVRVWYRRNAPEYKLIGLLKNRLKTTPFHLQTSKLQLEHNPKKPRPNFWITLPIYGREGFVKFYVIDNEKDNFLNSELITIERLQILETFCKVAGQIMENARQRNYLKKFQAMLTHGTVESLQLMRFYLEGVINEKKKSKRKELVDSADANLEIVQSALGSLLTIERGPSRIQKESVEINSLVNEQLEFFQAYARKATGIEFQLELFDEPVHCITDKTVILQILYNIVGNSIRHLKRIRDPCREKTLSISTEEKHNKILIEISDNGNGLPDEIKNFFLIPFRPGMSSPTGGLGLGFSREMADMLGGNLKLVEPPSLGRGSTFEISLQSGGDNE